jgi:hypothetical protein
MSERKEQNTDSAEAVKMEKSSRRNLLKSFAVGGGVVATGASMPKEWIKPALNHVVLPAHAQMSEEMEEDPITGVFSSEATLGLTFPQQSKGFAGRQYDLLNALVSQAHAGQGSASAFCGSDGPNGDSTIFFSIDDEGMVEIAIDSLNNSAPSTCGNTTTLSGTMIADVDIQISESFNDNNPVADYFVRLTNMVASASEVTGNYVTVFRDQDGGNNSDNFDDGDPIIEVGDGASACDGSFTASLGGSFPTYSTSCSDDD